MVIAPLSCHTYILLRVTPLHWLVEAVGGHLNSNVVCWGVEDVCTLVDLVHHQLGLVHVFNPDQGRTGIV